MGASAAARFIPAGSGGRFKPSDHQAQGARKRALKPERARVQVSIAIDCRDQPQESFSLAPPASGAMAIHGRWERVKQTMSPRAVRAGAAEARFERPDSYSRGERAPRERFSVGITASAAPGCFANTSTRRHIRVGKTARACPHMRARKASRAKSVVIISGREPIPDPQRPVRYRRCRSRRRIVRTGRRAGLPERPSRREWRGGPRVNSANPTAPADAVTHELHGKKTGNQDAERHGPIGCQGVLTTAFIAIGCGFFHIVFVEAMPVATSLQRSNSP